MRKKTHQHRRAVAACVEARKALVEVARMLDMTRNDDGELLTEEALADKAVRARVWLGKAEGQFSLVTANLAKEIEHRESEADPETIRHRRFQAELKQLSRQPKRRRTVAELAPEVLRLRDEGLLPAAIADAVGTSDNTVKRILKEASSV